MKTGVTEFIAPTNIMSEETEGIPKRIKVKNGDQIVRLLYPDFLKIQDSGQQIIDLYLGSASLIGIEKPPLPLKYYFPVYQLELSKIRERIGLSPEDRPSQEEFLTQIYDFFNSDHNPLLKSAHQKRIAKYQGHTNFAIGDIIMIGDSMYQMDENGFHQREGDVKINK